MFTGDYTCSSFKRELLLAAHDFAKTGGHLFKLALYTDLASLNAATTDYSTTNEVVGNGYTAGGLVLENKEPVLDDTVGFTSFEDLLFSAVSITARGALIYNTTFDGGSGTTNAIKVLDFGSNKSPAGNNFTIIFPPADGETAIIRIT